MEGYNTPGTLASRNNNPGNLRSGPGQIGTSGGFAVFPSPDAGFAALDNQIQLNAARGLTLNEFFAGKPGVYAGYAPSSDSNNPAAYASFVAGQTGLDPNTPLSSLLAGSGTSGDTSVLPVLSDGSLPPDSSPTPTSYDVPLLLAAAGIAAYALLS